MGSAINKYCYISCRYLPPFFWHKSRVVWSQIELCNENSEIEHPAVREILRYLNIGRGVEIHHLGDLPARSGMGSSSAFTVGLLHALYALKGLMPTKEKLAKESIFIEQELLRETVGVQDQIFASYGGFNHVTFSPTGDYSLRPMTLPAGRIEELNAHLMLFYTGIKRTASQIADSYVQKLASKEKMLFKMSEMVKEGISILNSRTNITAFGKLLYEYWHIKRGLSPKVTTPHVKEIYDAALSAGAIGGKLTGAGGGGFLLLFAPPAVQPKVKEKLSKLLYVPFKLEAGGSHIIFYSSDEDYSSQERARFARKIDPFREYSPD